MIAEELEPPLFDLSDPGQWPAPRVMAIDLAADKSGIACSAADRLDVSTFRPGKCDGHRRENAIKAEMARCIGLYRPHIILLEALYIPQQRHIGDGFLVLAFLHGVIRNFLYTEWTAPIVIINTSHLKIFATGKGSGVQKTDVVLGIERRYGHLVQVQDDNQADAFTMLAMARHEYGHPLSTVDGKDIPKTHLRALGMVAKQPGGWPTLSK